MAQPRAVAPLPRTTVPEPMDEPMADSMDKPMMAPTGEASADRGEALLREGRYADAAEALRAAYHGDTDSAETPRSLLLLGRSYESLGRRDLACGALRLAARHPKGSAVVNFRARQALERLSCAR
jgi:hypothetical protein